MKKGAVTSQAHTVTPPCSVRYSAHPQRFGNFFVKDKKGIGGVVAVALLLVVSVTAVISFQGWFNTYSSTLQNEVEIKSQDTKNSQIQRVIGDNLYFKNSDSKNISIDNVEVDGVSCNVSKQISSGIEKIDIKNCLENTTTNTPEVVVYTNKGIFTHSFYVDSSVKSQTSNFNSEIPTQGLIAEYLFENSTNLGEDTSGNDNHGTNNGSISTTGIIGDAVKFDGVDDYIYALPLNLINLSSGFSFSTWAKNDDLVKGTIFNGRNYDYTDNKYELVGFVQFRGTGLFKTQFRNKEDTTFTPTDSFNYNVDEWYHIVYLFNGDTKTQKLYINGAEINNYTVTGSGTFEFIDGKGNIGVHQFINGASEDQKNSYLNGSIDNFRIYDRTLNQSEINILYQEE